MIAETLPHQKPHPLPYLTGLERLGGHATKSVAFEDSRSGITAAAKAGVAVIGLTTSLDPETLKTHGAHLTGYLIGSEPSLSAGFGAAAPGAATSYPVGRPL